MTPGARERSRGYLIIMLMMAVFVIVIGFLVAVPVWQTEIQREKEEELIFRGRQYAEAVRIYLLKNPNQYPSSLEDLLDKKCIRKLYKDPLGPNGEWDVILATGRPGGGGGREAAQEVLVAPARALPSIKSARILGVVSSSKKRSIKIYNDQESHDKWLFFHGQDPKKLPRIVYHGEEK
jgi:hypothetical protein